MPTTGQASGPGADTEIEEVVCETGTAGPAPPFVHTTVVKSGVIDSNGV